MDSNDKCTQCKDFYINDNGVCLEIPDHLTTYCLETNFYNGIKMRDLQCETCGKKKIFYDFSSNEICVSKNYLKIFESHYTNYDAELLANCERMKLQVESSGKVTKIC